MFHLVTLLRGDEPKRNEDYAAVSEILRAVLAEFLKSTFPKNPHGPVSDGKKKPVTGLHEMILQIYNIALFDSSNLNQIFGAFTNFEPMIDFCGAELFLAMPILNKLRQRFNNYK